MMSQLQLLSHFLLQNESVSMMSQLEAQSKSVLIEREAYYNSAAGQAAASSSSSSTGPKKSVKAAADKDEEDEDDEEGDPTNSSVPDGLPKKLRKGMDTEKLNNALLAENVHLRKRLRR